MNSTRSRLSTVAAAIGFPPPTADADALAHSLDAALAEAAQRWPTVSLREEDYLTHIGRVCADNSAPYTALPSLALADLYLARACALGDDQAIVCFSQTLLSQVPRLVRRLSLSPAQVEDVELALRERLLLGATEADRRISTYQGQTPLLGWLRVIAVRAGLSMLRSKDDNPGVDDGGKAIERMVARDGDPELEQLQRRYQAEFKAAVKAAFAKLSSDDRGYLQMYYGSGMNTRQIAKLYNVVPTTASRWVATARENVSALARAELRARLKLSDTEMQSLFHALKSRIDWSLHTALGEGKPGGPTL